MSAFVFVLICAGFLAVTSILAFRIDTALVRRKERKRNSK